MHINDLKTDLKDGVALLNLLEIISGKPIGKRWNKNPRVPNQKYENNQIAIEFVQAEGLKLVNIGNSPSLLQSFALPIAPPLAATCLPLFF